MQINNEELINQQLVNIEASNSLETLEKGINRESIQKFMNEAFKLADSLTEQEKNKNDIRLACKEACSFCCYNQVAVTAPEIIMLTEYIRENFSDEEIIRIKAKIKLAHQKSAKLDYLKHKKLHLPCPFLIDKKCSVYEARPFACRGWNSARVEDCEDAFESNEDKGISVYGAQLLIANSIRKGILNAFAIKGNKPEIYKLISAMHIALNKENLPEEYLKNNNIFLEAKLSF